MPARPPTSMRELDSRDADGVHVRLLWDSAENRTAVIVLDRKTGDSFNVEVRPGDRALDVFNHPFAYAARQGVATRGRNRWCPSPRDAASPNRRPPDKRS